MPAGDDPEVDAEVMEEGCYHLSHLGLTTGQLAAYFEITPAEVESRIRS